ncbi:hypothetical protein KA005_02835 [bacterium]|nr:hypothetical protein [bacterium]
MKRQIKSIIIASLIIVLIGGYAAATEVGRATITVITMEDNNPSTVEYDSLQINTPMVAPQIQSYNNPVFFFTPKKSTFGDSLFTSSLITLTALNVADFFTTRQALKLPGLTEGNPFMKPFVKSTLLFTGVKLGITALDLLFLKKVYKKNKVLGWALSLAANFAMSYVVSNNMRLIQQARGI